MCRAEQRGLIGDTPDPAQTQIRLSHIAAGGSALRRHTDPTAPGQPASPGRFLVAGQTRSHLDNYIGPPTAVTQILRTLTLHRDSYRYIVVVSVAHPALPIQKRDQM
jgi:hypothetical protein